MIDQTRKDSWHSRPGQLVNVPLSRLEVHTVLEIVKAHRNHCAKIQPDNKYLLSVLDTAISNLGAYE